MEVQTIPTELPQSVRNVQVLLYTGQAVQNDRGWSRRVPGGFIQSTEESVAAG